jgi:hypothetical protein
MLERVGLKGFENRYPNRQGRKRIERLQ